MRHTSERHQRQPTLIPAQQIKDNRQTRDARKSKKSHIHRLASSFTASASNTACSGTSSSCSVSGRGPRRKPRSGRSCAYVRQSQQVHSSRSLRICEYKADRARRAMCSTTNRAKTGGAEHWSWSTASALRLSRSTSGLLRRRCSSVCVLDIVVGWSQDLGARGCE